MSGLCCRDRSGDCLEVTHLSNKDHIRVFTECRTESFTVAGGVTSDLSLVHYGFIMSVQILNRIFQRNNMVRIFLVDDMNQGCKCRGLTASGRPCHKNQASLTGGHIDYFLRDSESTRLRDFKRQTPHNRSICSSLLKYIDTKTSHTGNGIGEIYLPVFVEFFTVTLIHQRSKKFL